MELLMSFIGKLLRKTEPLTPAEGVTAPLDESALKGEPAVAQEFVDESSAADPADETRVDDPVPMLDEEAQLPSPQAEVASDTAWWEEPPPAVSATATHSNEIEPA